MKNGLAGSKDVFFLPSICDPVHDGSVAKSKHAATRKSRSTEETRQPSSRMFSNGKKLYSSAPTSESSTPFKLPSIQRSKSISVSNLASETKAGNYDSSSYSRAEITRSPSCPSLIDFKDDFINGNNLGSQLPPQNVYSKQPLAGGISCRFDFKLPNIFQQCDFTSSDSISSLTPRNMKSEKEDQIIKAQTIVDSPCTARRLVDSPCTARGQVDSPCTTRRQVISKSEKHDQHRPQQSYALLLPVTTTTRMSTRKAEGKRKTKKRKSSKDGGEAADLTNILKDKLVAIQVRESIENSSFQEEEERGEGGESVTDINDSITHVKK